VIHPDDSYWNFLYAEAAQAMQQFLNVISPGKRSFTLWCEAVLSIPGLFCQHLPKMKATFGIASGHSVYVPIFPGLYNFKSAYLAILKICKNLLEICIPKVQTFIVLVVIYLS